MHQKIKIAFLSAYSGPVNRGVESWVSDLSQRLTQKGYLIKVYQLGNPTNESYDVYKVDIPVDWNEKDMTGTPQRENDTDYWSLMLKRFSLALLPDISKFSPDIVVPLNGSWENKIIKNYCVLKNIKMVLVGHWNDEKGLKLSPDLFIATSTRQIEWAKTIYQGPIQLIYNGVDTVRYSNTGDQTPLQLPHPIVLSVGALVPGKNIEQTIRAVALLKNTSLIVCGDGDLRNEVEILGKKLLGNRFKIFHLDQEEMPNLYRSCDLFTLVPDTSESFGIVFLEAMASGLGIVTTDDKIRRSIVGNAGLFVASKNLEEYSQAINKALKKNWLDVALKQAEKFSLETTINRYDKVFQSLLL